MHEDRFEPTAQVKETEYQSDHHKDKCIIQIYYKELASEVK
jgi:hypothetical protein